MAKQIVCSKANLCCMSAQNSSVARVFSQSVEKKRGCGAARSSCIAGIPRSAAPFWGVRAPDKSAHAGQSVVLRTSRVWWAQEASLSLSSAEQHWENLDSALTRTSVTLPYLFFFFLCPNCCTTATLPAVVAVVTMQSCHTAAQKDSWFVLSLHPSYPTHVLCVMWLIEDIVSEQKRTHRLLCFVCESLNSIKWWKARLSATALARNTCTETPAVYL